MIYVSCGLLACGLAIRKFSQAFSRQGRLSTGNSMEWHGLYQMLHCPLWSFSQFMLHDKVNSCYTPLIFIGKPWLGIVLGARLWIQCFGGWDPAQQFRYALTPTRMLMQSFKVPLIDLLYEVLLVSSSFFTENSFWFGSKSPLQSSVNQSFLMTAACIIWTWLNMTFINLLCMREHSSWWCTYQRKLSKLGFTWFFFKFFSTWKRENFFLQFFSIFIASLPWNNLVFWPHLSSSDPLICSRSVKGTSAAEYEAGLRKVYTVSTVQVGMTWTREFSSSTRCNV